MAAGADELAEEIGGDDRVVSDPGLGEFEHAGAEGIDEDGVGITDVEHVDLLQAEWLVPDDRGKFDAGDPLKDEVGGAIGVLDGGPDDSEAGDGAGGFPAGPGLEHGDAEHPVGVERLGEHGPVPGFKDVQGEHRLGKQDATAENHDSDGVRYEHVGVYVESGRLQVEERFRMGGAARRSLEPPLDGVAGEEGVREGTRLTGGIWAGYCIGLRTGENGWEMSARVVAIFLGLACLGLGGGLYYVQDQATKERRAAAAASDQYKAELVRSETKLVEQLKVNASLETNLVRRVEEAGLISNKLGFITAELAKTEQEAKAAAEKARLEIEERQKRIEGLKGDKDELTAKLDELNGKIGGLQNQIRETERRLAASDGDREILKKELRRMLTEKADLEKRFADLSELKAQVSRLREEAYVARRMELIRKGVINFDQKGAVLLQQGIRRAAATNAPAEGGRLDVELRRDGTGRVLPVEPN